jgi:hypothetical protein
MLLLAFSTCFFGAARWGLRRLWLVLAVPIILMGCWGVLSAIVCLDSGFDSAFCTYTAGYGFWFFLLGPAGASLLVGGVGATFGLVAKAIYEAARRK